MRAIVGRGILPSLVLMAGVTALVYGGWVHHAPVLEEKESQTTIDVPAAFMPPSGMQNDFPFAQPPMTKKTVTKIDRVTKTVAESTITREVTVGGIVLLDSGTLKQTYSGSKGPALCPS
jgi:hypothetical protein